MPDTIAFIPIATADHLQAALHIREVVFTQEQQVPAALERDAHDAPTSTTAHHYLLQAGGKPVATGRWRLVSPAHSGLDAPAQAKIERCAVLWSYRKLGYGSRLVQGIVAAIPPELGVYLHAQARSIPFYERLGFQQEGDAFFEADIEHVKMRLR